MSGNGHGSRLPSFSPGDAFDGFKIVAKLGEGGFGAVYHVTNAAGKSFAAKLECLQIRTPVLIMELNILMKLNERSYKHFCTFYQRGKQPAFKYIIMTLTWKSLQDLRKARTSQCFTLETSIRVGKQCLEGLEELHNCSFLHRDVKPGNFAVGRKQDNKQKLIYLIDFGLSRRYILKTGSKKFRPPRKRAAFRGTVRYAPIVCHREQEFSPKDDVESWVYMLIEMTKAALPWKAITDKAGVTLWKENVRDSQHTRRHLLFADVPPEYQKMFALLENLNYYQMPPYKSIYTLIKTIQNRIQVLDEDPFDWEVGTGSKKTSNRRQGAPSIPNNVEDDTNMVDKTTATVTKTAGSVKQPEPPQPRRTRSAPGGRL